MLLFRSEGHVGRWLAGGEHPDGARMTTDQQWDLARRWFAGRHKPQWTKRSVEQVHEIFDAVGLTGEFWRLT